MPNTVARNGKRDLTQTRSNAKLNTIERNCKCIRMQSSMLSSKKALFAFAFKRVCVQMHLRSNVITFVFNRVCV